MTALRELVGNGGPALIAIMILSVLLYARCFHLLFFLRENPVSLARVQRAGLESLDAIRATQHRLQEEFRRQRVAIGAMITAAPLLGLLGTVMGMIAAFDSLARNGEQRSMEGLARGISEVLVDTESGLAVAIPALLLLYLAHRRMEKSVHRLAVLENRIREAL